MDEGDLMKTNTLTRLFVMGIQIPEQTFVEHFESDELGACSCGAPVRKIIGSSFTGRSDRVRYAPLDDTEGWCMYRCHDCHAVIGESYMPPGGVNK